MNPLHAVYGIIIIAIAGYLWHCESVKKAQALAVVVAEAAKEKAEKQAAADRLAKERADAQTHIDRARIADLSKRLSSERARSRILPAPSPATKRPDLACFSREDFERATGQLDQGLSAIALRCDERAVELAIARKWASDKP